MSSRFVQGKGRYLDDISVPDCLYVGFVRSPYAHALVDGISAPPHTQERLLYLATGAELAASLRPLRVEGPGAQAADWHGIPPDRVRFVGEPVAAVVARSRYEAEDLVDEIQVDYEPLPAVAGIEDALARKAVIHEEAPDNALFRRQYNPGSTEDAFTRADHVVTRSFRHARQTPCPLEGRGVIASFDSHSGRFTIWLSTQTPHIHRTALAEALGVTEDQIRVIMPDVGGAFGLKIHISPEEIVLPWLARKLGRPVKWVEDRRENLLGSGHAHEERINLSLALNSVGRFLAVRAEVNVDVGAHSVYPQGAAMQPMTTSLALFGAYRFETLEFAAVGLATNKAPAGAYRGVGNNAAVFATERLIDVAAAELNIDPAEIRLRNLLRAQDFPHTAPSGRVYDTGDYARPLEMALDHIGYQHLRREQEEARSLGKRFGIGIATFNDHSGAGSRDFRLRGTTLIPAYDGATVRITPDGTVYGMLSSASSGQGHEEAYSALIGEQLGVAPERVRIIEGDTDLCPTGSGTFNSRSAITIASSLQLACEDLRQKLLTIGRAMLQEEGEVVMADGRIASSTDTSKTVTLDEVIRAAYLRVPFFVLPEGVEPGLEVTRYYDPPQQVFPSSAHIVWLEVDPETGEFAVRRYVVADDCGRILFPRIAEAQVVGAVAQGIGGATLEEVVYDESGQPLTGSLMDYLLPTAAEIPKLEIIHLETPSSVTLSGAKGVAESGTIGARAAIANAVADALGPGAAELSELPVSPERVFRLARQE